MPEQATTSSESPVKSRCVSELRSPFLALEGDAEATQTQNMAMACAMRQGGGGSREGI